MKQMRSLFWSWYSSCPSSSQSDSLISTSMPARLMNGGLHRALVVEELGVALQVPQAQLVDQVLELLVLALQLHLHRPAVIEE